ncbi:transcriptional regulator, LacI family [Raineyella antarctica]|uniref:Transcriptional regulator, LacI family n=1 Tax=Raineyella antarctica TaxID=1577474 RepID=A0A1G6GIF8_9ACTN|nr:LacI family DNA-binding transcriptional regulator [Raineyella antarctica]SDB81699.1 transcriptional regulator, LacI family [Raineyella antarctica]
MSARPTIRDVARAAGVSVGTVSNALNRPDVVSADTLGRIEQAIEDLGFVRNASASQLRTGSSPTVGVVVTEISNPFFVEASTAMERRIRDEKCLMMLASSHGNAATEARLLRHFQEQNVRGVLLTPSDDDLSAAETLVAAGIPVVLFDVHGTSEKVSSVAADDVSGADAAVGHLLDLGHRRIAFLDGPIEVHQARDRLAGARLAYERRGLSPEEAGLRVVHLPQFDAEAGAAGTARLLRSEDEPCTAIFCANDLMALGVYRVLRQHDISVPEQMSVVGYDDITLAAQLSVPLTTVRQPMVRIGFTAADLLFRHEERAAHLLFKPELIIRDSTAAPVAGRTPKDR